MSYKSVLQIFILILILIILSSIYFIYFADRNELVSEDNDKITNLINDKNNEKDLVVKEKKNRRIK